MIFMCRLNNMLALQEIVLVKEGDYVLKGQPLTQGDGLRTLPVHAPTSGTVKFIGKHVAPILLV